MEPRVVPISKLSTLQQRLTTKQTSKHPELLYTDKINSWLQGDLAITRRLSSLGIMKSKPSRITNFVCPLFKSATRISNHNRVRLSIKVARRTTGLRPSGQNVNLKSIRMGYF